MDEINELEEKIRIFSGFIGVKWKN